MPAPPKRVTEKSLKAWYQKAKREIEERHQEEENLLEEIYERLFLKRKFSKLDSQTEFPTPCLDCKNRRKISQPYEGKVGSCHCSIEDGWDESFHGKYSSFRVVEERVLCPHMFKVDKSKVTPREEKCEFYEKDDFGKYFCADCYHHIIDRDDRNYARCKEEKDFYSTYSYPSRCNKYRDDKVVLKEELDKLGK